MSKTNWKQVERDCASIFGTTRFPANMGGILDFESDLVTGQVKNTKVMSLEQMTKLCEEMDDAAEPKGKSGVLTIKVSRGSGKKSPILVVMTEKSFIDYRNAYSEGGY